MIALVLTRPSGFFTLQGQFVDSQTAKLTASAGLCSVNAQTPFGLLPLTDLAVADTINIEGLHKRTVSRHAGCAGLNNFRDADGNSLITAKQLDLLDASSCMRCNNSS